MENKNPDPFGDFLSSDAFDISDLGDAPASMPEKLPQPGVLKFGDVEIPIKGEVQFTSNPDAENFERRLTRAGRPTLPDGRPIDCSTIHPIVLAVLDTLYDVKWNELEQRLGFLGQQFAHCLMTEMQTQAALMLDAECKGFIITNDAGVPVSGEWTINIEMLKKLVAHILWLTLITQTGFIKKINGEDE